MPAPHDRPIRVLCVDDNEDVCAALYRAIGREPGFVSLPSATSAEGLAERAAGADIILLDLGMPGPHPLAALAALTEAGVRARVIILSGLLGDDEFDAAFEAGAWGYFCKDDDIGELAEMVRSVHRGVSACSRSVTAMLRASGVDRPSGQEA